MPDKDDFTFFDEEKQDAPQSDLNDLFAESETPAEAPADPDAEQGTADETPVQEPAKPKSTGGPSRSRLLLLILLLIVLCGGGAYYFMGLGETTPEPSKPQAQTKKAEPVKKTVSLPPKPAATTQPAKTKDEETKAASSEKVEEKGAQKSVVVAVPPPTPSDNKAAPKAGENLSKPSAAKPAAAQTTAEAKAESPAAQASVPAAPSPVKSDTVGSFTLDAGSYLLAENVHRLEKTLSELGYQTTLTPIKAKVSMTRLSLGSYPQAEARKMLEFARAIDAGAFSMASGDAYEVFAGTFVNMENVRSLQQRFEKEGIKTEQRQVEVVRTLNRICFGDFTTRDEAQKEAAKMAEAGIIVTVVKGK